MSRIVDRPGCAWCEKRVATAGVLVDACDYYKAFYEAALGARRSILVSGWQFDSDVALLRGDDARDAPLPVTLKAFLNALCERTPDLSVRLLAWDFHVVFALEREWMQRLLFDWTTHERLSFRFDSSHVDKGCHHQKFVVIDGQITFLGGLDLCDHRWDTRDHREDEPLRASRGEPHKPFHDVQTYLVGREVGAALEDLFVCRWKLAGGETFDPLDPSDDEVRTTTSQWLASPPRGALVLPTSRVALSRNDPKGSPCPTPSTDAASHEITDLFVGAIESAARTIYIETQYFSSARISEALVQRLRAEGRSALDVVLVLNLRAETLKEEVAVGLAQANVLRDLRAAAEGTDHRLGIYYTVPASKDGSEPTRATYIHAKLMIVDDRFLAIGSANLTNRSTSVDTEINASFEAEHERDPLVETIRRLRLDLVAEHLGASPRALTFDEARVDALDDRARRADGRLRLHPSPTPNERRVIELIDPQALPFDPHGLEDEEEERSIFARGIDRLFRTLLSNRDDRK